MLEYYGEMNMLSRLELEKEVLEISIEETKLKSPIIETFLTESFYIE
jgi:hypothetical protein